MVAQDREEFAALAVGTTEHARFHGVFRCSIQNRLTALTKITSRLLSENGGAHGQKHLVWCYEAFIPRAFLKFSPKRLDVHGIIEMKRANALSDKPLEHAANAQSDAEVVSQGADIESLPANDPHTYIGRGDINYVELVNPDRPWLSTNVFATASALVEGYTIALDCAVNRWRLHDVTLKCAKRFMGVGLCYRRGVGLAQHFAFSVVRIGRHAKLDVCQIFLPGVDQILGEPRGLAYEDRQNARRCRIKRARVTDTLLTASAPNKPYDIERRPVRWLVDVEDGTESHLLI